MYVAEKELGMNIPESIAEKVLARVKQAFSQEGRRSPYTSSELRELINETERES